MGFMDKIFKALAKETAKQVLKTPEQRERERGQVEADRLGKELGMQLEFVETMTQEEYDRYINKQNDNDEILFNRVDNECRRICDHVFDSHQDFLYGKITRLEVYMIIKEARAELKKCVDLAVDENGHNLGVIESTIEPAEKWLDEVEQSIM